MRFDNGSKWYLPANGLTVVEAGEQGPDTQQSAESDKDSAFAIRAFGDYHSYHGGRNKLFGPDDQRILQLKNGDAQAVDYYVQFLAPKSCSRCTAPGFLDTRLRYAA